MFIKWGHLFWWKYFETIIFWVIYLIIPFIIITKSIFLCNFWSNVMCWRIICCFDVWWRIILNIVLCDISFFWIFKCLLVIENPLVFLCVSSMQKIIFIKKIPLYRIPSYIEPWIIKIILTFIKSRIITQLSPSQWLLSCLFIKGKYEDWKKTNCATLLRWFLGIYKDLTEIICRMLIKQIKNYHTNLPFNYKKNHMFNQI